MRGLSLMLSVALGLVTSVSAHAGDQIHIVGSSTVYPFSTAVAERFGRTTTFATPAVESTGTGGGMKLFCAGDGLDTPDFTNASRAIKKSEIDLCAQNGVGGIVEMKIGYDGIVLANSAEATRYDLSLRDIYLALAKDVPMEDGGWTPNPHKTWKDVNPDLPDIRIEVYGPPPTSGTRDAFVELAMEGGCKTFPEVKALAQTDKKTYKTRCHSIREDGAYIEAGENDNLIVQKLNANHAALGIFGFGYLEQNYDIVQGSTIDGIEPTFENISDGSYPVSRALYVYVKKDHVGKVPGMMEFIEEYTSERAWGPEGYLIDKGLIPMSDEERSQVREQVRSLHELGSM